MADVWREFEAGWQYYSGSNVRSKILVIFPINQQYRMIDLRDTLSVCIYLNIVKEICCLARS